MNPTNEQFQKFQKSYRQMIDRLKDIAKSENLSQVSGFAKSYEGLKSEVRWWDKNRLKEAKMTTEQLQQWDSFLRTLSIQPNMLQRSEYLLRKPVEDRKDKTPRQYKNK